MSIAAFLLRVLEVQSLFDNAQAFEQTVFDTYKIKPSGESIADWQSCLQPVKPRAPRRTVEEWRPDPLLCRRFNVPDPFRGQAAPTVDGPKFKTDLLALPETAAAAHLALPGRAQDQSSSSVSPSYLLNMIQVHCFIRSSSVEAELMFYSDVPSL